MLNINENDEDYTFIKQRNKNIKPALIIEEEVTYEILNVPKEYIINDYNIILKDNLLVGVVVIDAWHPNASDDPNCEEDNELMDMPPEKQLFCLPEDMIHKNYENDQKDLIERVDHLLKTWNYKNSYWKQWLNITYMEKNNMNKENVTNDSDNITNDDELTLTEIYKGLKNNKTRNLTFKILKLRSDLEFLSYSTFRNLTNPTFIQKIGLIISGFDKGHDHLVEYIKWRKSNE